MFGCMQSVVLSLFIIFCVQAQQEAGDSCRTSTGTSGICKFLTDCPSALDELRRGRYPNDICGFLGTQSIICCTDTIRPVPPTPRPPIPRPPTPRPPTPKPTNKPTLKPTIVSRGKVGEVAAQMCKYYAQYAYEYSDDPGLSILTDGTIGELNCPYEKEALIVGGKLASRKEFPHMVQVGYITGSEINWGCGGSLISKTFVLTAGHCMATTNMGEPKIIRAGITNMTDLQKSQERRVKRLYTHPEYTIYKYNDIGLIEVVSSFEMNTFVRPACIFTRKEIPVRNAIASGWGRIAYAGDGSNDLLKVVLQLFGNAQCNSTYRRNIIEPGSTIPNGIVDDSMICAGSKTEFKDTCQGDSGGPLQIYHEVTPDIQCMYEIIGVTSFGKSCGLAKNLPGVYTRVSKYTKWIEETVWPR